MNKYKTFTLFIAILLASTQITTEILACEGSLNPWIDYWGQIIPNQYLRFS